MIYDRYFTELHTRLDMLQQQSRSAIDEGADLVAATILRGNRIFLFGSGHSNLVVQDLCARASTLPFFNPIFVPGLLPTDYPYLRPELIERLSGIAAAVLETSPVESGDCLIVVSNSGRNHVPIEMAIEGRARGLALIGVTGMETGKSVV